MIDPSGAQVPHEAFRKRKPVAEQLLGGGSFLGGQLWCRSLAHEAETTT